MESSALRRHALFLYGSWVFPLAAIGLSFLGRGLYIDFDLDRAIRTSGGMFFPALLLILILPILLPKVISAQREWLSKHGTDVVALRRNRIFQATMPLLIVFLCSDSLSLLFSSQVSFLFKDLLGCALLATAVCSVAILREGLLPANFRS